MGNVVQLPIDPLRARLAESDALINRLEAKAGVLPTQAERSSDNVAPITSDPRARALTESRLDAQRLRKAAAESRALLDNVVPITTDRITFLLAESAALIAQLRASVQARELRGRLPMSSEEPLLSPDPPTPESPEEAGTDNVVPISTDPRSLLRASLVEHRAKLAIIREHLQAVDDAKVQRLRDREAAAKKDTPCPK